LAVFRPLIKCGEQSLEVFCVGVYLAFVAHFVLITVSNGLFAQLIVGACGLSIMIAVACYRSWSKQVGPACASRRHFGQSTRGLNAVRSLRFENSDNITVCICKA
jgi:hypothetical protein